MKKLGVAILLAFDLWFFGTLIYLALFRPAHGQIIPLTSEDKSQILVLKSQPAPPDDLFFARYEFDDCDCTGTNCEEEVLTDSINNNHGEISSATSETSCRLGYFRPLTTYTSGSSPYGALPSFFDLCDDGDCSIAAWVKMLPGQTQDQYIYIETRIAAPHKYFGLRIANGTARLTTSNDADTFKEIQNTTSLMTDTWFFVSVVFANGSANVCVNLSCATNTIPGVFTLENNAIAAYNEIPPCCAFIGKLGALYLSDRNWTDIELSDIFNTSSPNEIPESGGPILQTSDCQTIVRQIWLETYGYENAEPFEISASLTQSQSACYPFIPLIPTRN